MRMVKSGENVCRSGSNYGGGNDGGCGEGGQILEKRKVCLTLNSRTPCLSVSSSAAVQTSLLRGLFADGVSFPLDVDPCGSELMPSAYSSSSSSSSSSSEFSSSSLMSLSSSSLLSLHPSSSWIEKLRATRRCVTSLRECHCVQRHLWVRTNTHREMKSCVLLYHMQGTNSCAHSVM